MINKFYIRAADAVYKVTGEATSVGMQLQAASYGGDSVYMAVTGVPKTLIIHVHSFSGVNTEITVEPAKSNLLSISDCVVICPQLFGPAGQPNTCGSPAQLALLNSIIQQAKSDYGCDTVLMVGVSGGAGLGPTFIGAYPGVVQGASFWCGYNDLAQWYAESQAAGHVYNQLMDQTFGGGPTGALAATYLAQSPKGVLANAKNCTIFINDGQLDTDIPPHHRTDMRDELLSLPPSAGVACQYIGYPNMGHAIDWPTAVAQLKSLITPVS